jgi:hypothetical protein
LVQAGTQSSPADHGGETRRAVEEAVSQHPGPEQARTYAVNLLRCPAQTMHADSRTPDIVGFANVRFLPQEGS